jgi:hypothetical protein
MCVCAAVSSFSKLFMFHLPKKGVSGRLLLQLGPKIHGPSETVGLCVTTDSFALLQNTMLFSERIIVNLTMMDSGLTCLSFNRLHIDAPAAAAHMLVVYVLVSEEVIVDATLAICSIAAR